MKARLKEKRLRDALTPFLSKIPMVERPKRRVPFKTKLAFTIGILILYFALGNIPLFGLSLESLDLFGRWRAIFASQRFSLSAVGIMPIISASIILQILAGPKIMKLDLTNPRDQAFYLNMQKLLVLCFVVFTSYTLTMGFYMLNQTIADQLGVSLRFISFLLFLQVFFGGMLIYYMEEVVSRWGIGSGVGLFIVAGVSQQVITGLISPIRVEGWAVGVIPRWIQIAQQVEPYEILRGGITFLFDHHLIALITTVALFFLVIYLESARIELKIPGYLKRRGGRRRVRFSVKLVHFMYPVVIPLLFLNLGRSLQASIQGFGRMFYTRGITIFGTYDEYGTAVSGLMYYLNPIYSPWDWVPPLLHSAYPNVAGWQIVIKVATDMSIMVTCAMIIALLWIKLSPGMEAKDIKAMIRNSKLPIYGHSRDLKAIKRAVDRYTPKIAMMGSGVLGALLVIGNMFGTLGTVSVLYLFLSVIVIYGIYEEITSEWS
ncbi:Protein translocase subunit SecY [subsurface metagenome]|nr:preprotein translocase subunit SecY [Methanosarcinales archaeon]